ncbi:hypothetical protein OAG91_01280 [bacterium]|nr:hypothetical protein [bacterium]
MKGRIFCESQIGAIFKVADAKLVRHNRFISQHTDHNWMSKYGGMFASEVKHKKEIEAEHANLERMFYDLAREDEALKDLIEKSSNALVEPGGSHLAQIEKKASV